jgi:hypothetical protein
MSTPPSIPTFPPKHRQGDVVITNWPPNLRRHEAARYLRDVHGIPVQASTLAKWFCVKSDGPRAHSAGRIPLYPRAELDAWAARRLGPLRSSTSG